MMIMNGKNKILELKPYFRSDGLLGNNDRPTDGPTNQQTDHPTNRSETKKQIIHLIFI